jgi:putative endonuclease
MYYVYILFCVKDKGLYIGYTSDLKKRFQNHKVGNVKSTVNRLPVELVHYEAFLIKDDAKARERYLKSGYGREQLRSQLKRLFKKYI